MAEMKRVIRDRYLTPDEVAKYRAIRAEIAAELPELIAEHHRFMARRDLLAQLQAAQAAKGLTLAELSGLSAQSKAALAAAVADRNAKVPVKLLRRYARAVGKRLVLAVADA